jgi:hypothetical protein
MTAVTLTLSCSNDAIDSTVRAVQATGVRVEQVHRNLGIVTGEVDPARIPELRDLDGVGAVETPHGFTAPPPGSAVQ